MADINISVGTTTDLSSIAAVRDALRSLTAEAAMQTKAVNKSIGFLQSKGVKIKFDANAADIRGEIGKVEIAIEAAATEAQTLGRSFDLNKAINAMDRLTRSALALREAQQGITRANTAGAFVAPTSTPVIPVTRPQPPPPTWNGAQQWPSMPPPRTNSGPPSAGGPPPLSAPIQPVWGPVPPPPVIPPVPVTVNLTAAQARMEVLAQAARDIGGVPINLDVRSTDTIAKIKAIDDAVTAVKARMENPADIVDPADLQRALQYLNQLLAAVKNVGTAAGTTSVEADRIGAAFGAASTRITQTQRQAQQQIMRTSGLSTAMGRVLQDSQYGMLGMANNLQQVAELYGDAVNSAKAYAIANGRDVPSGMAVAGQAITGMFTGVGLLTTAMTVFTIWASGGFDKIGESIRRAGENLGWFERIMGDSVKGFEGGRKSAFEEYAKSLSGPELERAAADNKRVLEGMERDLGDMVTGFGAYQIKAGEFHAEYEARMDPIIARQVKRVDDMREANTILDDTLGDTRGEEAARAAIARFEDSLASAARRARQLSDDLAAINWEAEANRIRAAYNGIEEATRLASGQFNEDIRGASQETAEYLKTMYGQQGGALADAFVRNGQVVWTYARNTSAAVRQEIQATARAQFDARKGLAESERELSLVTGQEAQTKADGVSDRAAEAARNRAAAAERAAEAARQRAIAFAESQRQLRERADIAAEDASVQLMAQGQARQLAEMELGQRRRIAALGEHARNTAETAARIDAAQAAIEASGARERIRIETASREEALTVTSEYAESELDILRARFATEAAMRREFGLEAARSAERDAMRERGIAVRAARQQLDTVQRQIASIQQERDDYRAWLLAHPQPDSIANSGDAAPAVGTGNRTSENEFSTEFAAPEVGIEDAGERELLDRDRAAQLLQLEVQLRVLTAQLAQADAEGARAMYEAQRTTQALVTAEYIEARDQIEAIEDFYHDTETIRREAAEYNPKGGGLLGKLIGDTDSFSEQIGRAQREIDKAIDDSFDDENAEADQIRERGRARGDSEWAILNEILIMHERYNDRRNALGQEGIADEERLASARRSLIRDSSMKVLTDIGSASESLYNTWRTGRERELEAEGKTEEERSEILDREGKKRFAITKGIRIAEAIVNTISAGVAAYRTGVTIGGPAGLAVGAAMMGAALLTGYAQVKALQATQADGSGGGGSSSGAPSGSFSVLSNGITSNRVAGIEAAAGVGSAGSPARIAERMENAAISMERSASNLTATTSPATAEANFQVGANRATTLNR